MGYSILGDKRRALDWVRLAFEINPRDPWTSVYAADIHAQLSEDHQAIEYLRQAIDGGFLMQHLLDWPHFRLYELRSHPEVRALRDQLSVKVSALRKQY